MSESRKCEHGKIKGHCDDCDLIYLQNANAYLHSVINEKEIQNSFLQNELLKSKVDYLTIINRLQDRIDAIHAAHKKAFCQVVKRVLKRYTQASLKVARRVAEAISKKFKGV